MDANNSVPVLGADLTGLSNEQILLWYAKHPHVTVRSLVSRLAWVLDQQQKHINEAYAAGFKAHADSRTSYVLSKLSEDELPYLEA
jgi:hypothetical protein